MATVALRHLLDAAEALQEHLEHRDEMEHAEEEHSGHSHAETITDCEGSPTLTLRIIAVFVVLAGALIGGLPPVFMKYFQSVEASGARMLRAFSGGLILALALVHIVPEAIEQLDGLVDYPLGGIPVLGGILVLVIIDNMLTAAFSVPHDHSHHAGNDHGAGGVIHTSKDAGAPVKDAAAAAAAAVGDRHHHHHPHADDDDAAAAGDLEAAANAAAAAAAGATHAHQCLRMTSQNFVSSVATNRAANVRQFVTAYTMELGCIFHSVIIGVSLGVIQCDEQLALTLMIALTIHQGLEALSLSSVLALTSFSRTKRAAMIVLYALVTPLGIGIGIAIATTYDPDSTVSRAVQGSLNGVAAGMLLYISILQLIGEEFSRQDLMEPRNRWLRLGLYASLLLGAACMCIIGIWA